jgi:murein DD-endopeptidase MepM/ murein hydrolase activator NlpD
MVNESVSSQRKHLINWSGSLKLPLITLVALIKFTGLIGLVIILSLSILIKSKPQIMAYKVPPLNFNHSKQITPNEIVIPTQIFLTAEASFATSTPLKVAVLQSSPTEIEQTKTATHTQRPQNTRTASITPTHTTIPTSTFTPTPTSTSTSSPTPTATSIMSAYESEMSTPIQGVGLDELQLIISQQYNVPNIRQDTGHQGVDLGSYDFKGKNLSGKPILAVFSGKVAGLTYDRPPLGNFVMIETSYDQLPLALAIKFNVVPGQSLYHLYGHMLKPTSFQIGDKIKVGQEIGQVGKSQTAEQHLHLEFRVGPAEQTFAAMAYYIADATQSERDSYMRWRTSGQFIPYDPLKWLVINKP